MMTNDNYPIGAANDKLAPYNQELDKEFEIYVSLVVSKTIKLPFPKSMSKEDVKEHLKDIKFVERNTQLILNNCDVVIEDIIVEE